MNEHALKRYQAGRCDAHGNRVIADDQNYLRGWFAAFMNLDILNGRNPFEAANDKSLCPLDRINYRRACIQVDRLIESYLSMDAYDAFDDAREVL